MSAEEADPLLNALQAALARAQVPAPRHLQVAAGKTLARAGQAPA